MPTLDTLAALQRHLHALMRARADALIEAHGVALPDLVADPPTGRPTWIPIPGMYGGFAYRLLPDDPPRLVVESWSRVVGGSGQRHEVTADGWALVEQGFV